MTANPVKSIIPPYLLYTIDTMPGSSGAPVFNDLWEVVTLHHAWDPVANHNEGVMVSRIHADAWQSALWPLK